MSIFRVRNFSMVFMATCLMTACGDSEPATGAGLDESALSGDNAVTYNRLRLTRGDFDVKKNTAECLALRAKVMLKRDTVKAQSEWNSLVKTAEYEDFDRELKHFHGLGCDEVGELSDACKAQQKTIDGLTGAVAKTPQWSSLENNGNWHELHEEYSKGQKLDCFEQLID